MSHERFIRSMNTSHAIARLGGKAAPKAGYVIRGEGDAWGCEIYPTLDEALERIRLVVEHTDWDNPIVQRDAYHKGSIQFDPEDDRITIWEVLPSGHRRCVWHFSGWHWSTGDYFKEDGSILEQGCLPGHDRSLYEEVMDEMDNY